MLELLRQILSWFADPAHWTGGDGLLARLAEHLEYSALSTFAAALIALPIGLAIGHTGRGAFLAVNATGFGRALPTIGVVTLVFLVSGLSLWPVYIALVVLAVPAIVTNTYAGMAAVPPELRDAARGMGMTGWQRLWQVEVPVAAPLILTGIRLAAIQVIATATMAAYVSFGGFGRYLFDGLAQRDLPQVLAGATSVAVLAIATDLLLAALQRALTPRGLRDTRKEAHA
ncbi:ABC transporter permease [Nonomuraea sp. NPDC050153]|uniref:ABC transporter permease n=1 Tax=Nonomuraea sp. NPDC050153 TaxID=3364359 RepID=UPI0037A26EA8